MNQGTHKNSLTKTALVAMATGTCVKLSAADSTKIEPCGATDEACLGALLDSVQAGDNVAIALFGVSNSTILAAANGAIATGAKVYLAADGKVAADGTIFVGIALDSAVIDGNLIELAHRAPTEETV